MRGVDGGCRVGWFGDWFVKGPFLLFDGEYSSDARFGQQGQKGRS